MRITTEQLGSADVGSIEAFSLWVPTGYFRAFELIHEVVVRAVEVPQDDVLQWSDGRLASMAAFRYFLGLRSRPEVDPMDYLDSLQKAETQKSLLVPRVRRARPADLSALIQDSTVHSLGSTVTARLLYAYKPPQGVVLKDMRELIESELSHENK